MIPAGSEGDRLRDEGMARALDAAPPTWTANARDAIDRLADTGRRFTADDVTALVGLPNESAQNRNNAVGAVLSGAARRGVIRRVGDHVANRATSHSRRLTVWVGANAPCLHCWGDPPKGHTCPVCGRTTP